ncbi:hypothetical protein FOC4_g10000184, partial [Fusarium odoratissimum]
QSAEAFLQWVEKVDPTTWIVYSDGSLSSEGVASCGFAIHQKDLSICEGSGREQALVLVQDHIFSAARPTS